VSFGESEHPEPVCCANHCHPRHPEHDWTATKTTDESGCVL